VDGSRIAAGEQSFWRVGRVQSCVRPVHAVARVDRWPSRSSRAGPRSASRATTSETLRGVSRLPVWPMRHRRSSSSRPGRTSSSCCQAAAAAGPRQVPHEAANCRPERQRSGSLTEAASAVAETMPGQQLRLQSGELLRRSANSARARGW